VEFRTKNYYQVKTKVKYKHINISDSTETKFWGLINDETLSWNQHVDQRATKLCSTCFALRNLKHTVLLSSLRTIYYAYIHSIPSYGVIFWGRSSNVTKLFILHKRTVRIITNTGVRESCREAFKNTEIMMFYSQYIFSLILFAVKNKRLFTSNKDIHIHKIRNYTNLHLPTVNFTKFYNGSYILGYKAYNHLPPYIKTNAYSPQIRIYIYTKSGTTQIYIYQLLISPNSIKDLTYWVIKPIITFHQI